MHKQNSNMMHSFSFFFVLVKNYSLLIRFSHMSQGVDGKSHKEINSFISLIIWVLHRRRPLPGAFAHCAAAPPPRLPLPPRPASQTPAAVDAPPPTRRPAHPPSSPAAGRRPARPVAHINRGAPSLPATSPPAILSK